MLTIKQFRINLTETNDRKYRKISRESRLFAKVYGKFVDDKLINDAIDDFLYALRTHLLMKNFKLKKIDEYFSKVIMNNQKIMIEHSNINSKLKEISSKMINKFNNNLKQRS